MTALRVLHVDDEPDIREVVEVSLGLDPDFTTRSCGSGEEALAVAAEWPPDIILLDVMMPAMDGPTTLARLRDNTRTAGIPVVFMTARTQSSDLDFFRSIGAAGVIPKPFDPLTLAASVRNCMRPDEWLDDAMRKAFLRRVKDDAATAFQNETDSPLEATGFGDIMHASAGDLRRPMSS
jgi:CheY-like chemotaxis protein